MKPRKKLLLAVFAVLAAIMLWYAQKLDNQNRYVSCVSMVSLYIKKGALPPKPSPHERCKKYIR